MDILIDESDGSLWVAAIEKGQLQGLEIDPEEEEVRWGSVYWAKVIRIDAALDAAFLDLDGDNTGILYNADVRAKESDGTIRKGGTEAIGKTLRPGQMVAVQAKAGYLPADNTDTEIPIEQKSPRMSMNITLPGRYLIYAPLMQENQISQRIRDKKLRKQLLDMLRSMDDIKGCILRAASQNTQTDILVREAKILRHMWDKIHDYLEGSAPQLIMLGPAAIQRTLSDHAGKRIGRIEVVTLEQFEAAEDWCDLFAPDLVTKVMPIELENPYEDLALFDHRDIRGQIEAMFQPYTLLPGGGSIILQETAALTAVDVNKGSGKQSNLTVNIEAAEEVARQVRVRNIGGIIMVDFLKLKTKKDEGILIAALEDALNADPCTVQIHGMTALGLMELTRARRTPPLRERSGSEF